MSIILNPRGIIVDIQRIGNSSNHSVAVVPATVDTDTLKVQTIDGNLMYFDKSHPGGELCDIHVTTDTHLQNLQDRMRPAGREREV